MKHPLSLRHGCRAGAKFSSPERGEIIPTAGIGFRLVRKVKVNLGSLNIRSGPGTKFPVVGIVKKGAVLEATRELSGWGKST